MFFPQLDTAVKTETEQLEKPEHRVDERDRYAKRYYSRERPAERRYRAVRYRNNYKTCQYELHSPGIYLCKSLDDAYNRARESRCRNQRYNYYT